MTLSRSCLEGLVLLALLAPPAFAAGNGDPPAAAVRVRLTAAERVEFRIIGSDGPGSSRLRNRSFIGTLEPAAADSVGLRVDGMRVVLPAGSVTKFEVLRGRSRNAGKGILKGVLIGGGVGALGSIGSEGEMSGPGVGALLGGMAGIVIGGIIGVATTSERWEELPLDTFRAWRPQADSLGGAGAPAEPREVRGLGARERIFPGERVRVSAPVYDLEPIVGRLHLWSDSAITVVRPAGMAEMRMREVLSVEVQRGSRGNGGLGTLIGFGCGFLTGAIIHQATKDGDTGSMGMAWGIIGTPLGFAVGSVIRTSKWEPVPLTIKTAQSESRN